jgi:hypothetical protein
MALPYVHYETRRHQIHQTSSHQFHKVHNHRMQDNSSPEYKVRNNYNTKSKFLSPQLYIYTLKGARYILTNMNKNKTH